MNSLNEGFADRSLGRSSRGRGDGGGGGDGVVVWQWANDDTDWAIYEAPVSNYIEDCCSSSQRGVLLGNVDPKLGNQMVDLERMVVTNGFGAERPVRRTICNNDSAVAHGAIWQWGNERIQQNLKQYVWHTYSMDAANILESAYCNGSKGVVDLEVNPINEPYIVDLSTMQQINKTSKFSRPVQRVRTNVGYRTVSNNQQPRHRGSWLASNSNLTSTFGPSSQSLCSCSFKGSLSSFQNGPPSSSNGSHFTPFGTLCAGVQPGTGAFGGNFGKDFAFSAPLPGGRPFFNAAPPAASMQMPPPPSRNVKRAKTWRQNPAPVVSLNMNVAPPPTFSFPAQPSSNNWPVNSVPQSSTPFRSNWNANVNQSSLNPPQGNSSAQWAGSSGEPTSDLAQRCSSSAFQMWSDAAPASNFSFVTWPSSNNCPSNSGFTFSAPLSSIPIRSTGNCNTSINQPLLNPPQGNSSAQWAGSSGEPTSDPAQGCSSSAFKTWRDLSTNSSATHTANSASAEQSQSVSQSIVSSVSSSSKSGSSSSYFSSASSAVSALISGFSKMVVIPYRYFATGVKSNQSESSDNSDNPSSAVTPSGMKPGARSIGDGNPWRAKRLKVELELEKIQHIEQDDLSFIQKLTAKDVLGKYIKDVPKPPKNKDCRICCDSLHEASGYGQGDSYTVVQLVNCSHMFHVDCLSAVYDRSPKNGSIQCPSCNTIYGIKYGNCPNGIMKYKISNRELPGFSGAMTIEIVYDISPGLQSEGHPNPGRPYEVRGFPKICYLPSNQDGQKVLDLLIIAWKRRLTFRIETTFNADVVEWNEIHHKTEINNSHGLGYPDPKYLGTVLGQLAAHGVTDDDSQ